MGIDERLKRIEAKLDMILGVTKKATNFEKGPAILSRTAPRKVLQQNAINKRLKTALKK